MAGGGNNEFQWYVNDRANSYTTNGTLHLKPTFMADLFGEEILSSGRVVIPDSECTDGSNNGCDRRGSTESIINPIRSARVDSSPSFAFKYGTLEVRAKMPRGDWIWPALWLMPRYSVYGGWPRSGEIVRTIKKVLNYLYKYSFAQDLMEGRGNQALFNDGVHAGVEQTGSTMHFGPDGGRNGWPTSHATMNRSPGFDADFHRYKLVWTPLQIEFFVDDEIILTVNAGNGFWEKGGFTESGLPNLWAGGDIMAPFDQEFYVILNNAIGGSYYILSFTSLKSVLNFF